MPSAAGTLTFGKRDSVYKRCCPVPRAIPIPTISGACYDLNIKSLTRSRSRCSVPM